MENHPTYNISVSGKEEIVEIVIEGEWEQNDFDEIKNDILSVIEIKGSEKVLIDVSGVTGRPGVAETYVRVRNYPPRIYLIRIAMVNINGADEFQRFHENTAFNAGMRLKWFNDLESAKAWLNKK